ncbi:MAG TPA: hypothetical protein VNA57_00575 [Acidimicrobiales bacterium]|nr:hypothetical protein [Acidimicrobiales bacterium]
METAPPADAPPPSQPPPPPPPPLPGNEGSIAAAVRDLVRTALTAAGKAGSVSLTAVGDTLESPARGLAGRITAGAVSQPRSVASQADLAAALADQPRAPQLGGATGAALAAKVAKRVGPLRFLARRTPLWLVVTAAPALHASVSLGAEELALVSSHLVHRARADGLEPDAERVRRAAVQLLSGATVDPDVEPRYAPLAVAWLQRALRAALPFSSGVATRNPIPLAQAASALDPKSVAGTPRPPAIGEV